MDDVLPPSFVGRISGPVGSLAADLKHKCELHLGAKHSAERLQRCWGSGAGFKFDETKESIRSMLQVGGAGLRCMESQQSAWAVRAAQVAVAAHAMTALGTWLW